MAVCKRQCVSLSTIIGVNDAFQKLQRRVKGRKRAGDLGSSSPLRGLFPLVDFGELLHLGSPLRLIGTERGGWYMYGEPVTLFVVVDSSFPFYV